MGRVNVTITIYERVAFGEKVIYPGFTRLRVIMRKFTLISYKAYKVPDIIKTSSITAHCITNHLGCAKVFQYHVSVTTRRTTL